MAEQDTCGVYHITRNGSVSFDTYRPFALRARPPAGEVSVNLYENTRLILILVVHILIY